MERLSQIARNLRRKLILLSLLTLGGLLAALIWLATNAQRQAYEKNALGRLQGIARTLALQIDGDAHQKLLQTHKEAKAIQSNPQDALYQKLYRPLLAAQEANHLTAPIITLVPQGTKSKDPQRFLLAVSSAKKPSFRQAYTPPDTLRSHYHIGGIVHPYTNDGGTWLSAFAPVRNQQGDTVCVVLVKLRFDRFLTLTTQRLHKHSTVGVLLLVGLLLLFVFFSIRLTMPLQDLQQTLEQEKESQLDLLHQQRDMQQSIEHLTSILDSVIDGVLVTDRSGKIVHINPAFLQMMGQKSTVMLGKKYTEFTNPTLVQIMAQAQMHRDMVIRQQLETAEGASSQVIALGVHQLNEDTRPEDDTWIGILVLLRSTSVSI